MELRGFREKAGKTLITFRRDISAIKKLVPLDYCKKRKGFSLDADAIYTNPFLETALESFEILSSLNADGGLPKYVIPEKRNPAGTEYFIFLARCISNKEYVCFDYFKFDEEQNSSPVVAPYALKSSRGRWYLLGRPEGEQGIKAYGLDRISNPAGMGKRYRERVSAEEIVKLYEDCFAMFNTEKAGQDVVLAFDRRDGNYIKSYPIHPSQKTEDKQDGVIVHLRIKITPDFIMELMSRAWSVRVIAPESLRKELHRIFSGAVKRNK